MNAKLTKLLLPGGFALAAVLLLWYYARSLREEVEGGARESILVAAEEVPAGGRISKANLAVHEVPHNYVHPQALRKGDENQIIGRPVAVKIEATQPLLWSDFDLQKSSATRALSAVVSKGQRALTLPVDVSGSLAGMLRPGDHVDLLGTFARGTQSTDYATVTLLQNVLVLATGDQRGEGEGEGGGGSGGSSAARTFANITVAVDLEEAELIVFAMHRGPLNVVLRAREDIQTVEDLPEKNFSDIFESQRRAEFAQRRQERIRALKPR